MQRQGVGTHTAVTRPAVQVTPSQGSVMAQGSPTAVQFASASAEVPATAAFRPSSALVSLAAAAGAAAAHSSSAARRAAPALPRRRCRIEGGGGAGTGCAALQGVGTETRQGWHAPERLNASLQLQERPSPRRDPPAGPRALHSPTSTRTVARHFPLPTLPGCPTRLAIARIGQDVCVGARHALQRFGGRSTSARAPRLLLPLCPWGRRPPHTWLLTHVHSGTASSAAPVVIKAITSGLGGIDSLRPCSTPLTALRVCKQSACTPPAPKVVDSRGSGSRRTVASMVRPPSS